MAINMVAQYVGGFVTANHTGATGWAVDQAVGSASGFLSKIPGVKPRYACSTAKAMVGGADAQ